MILSKKNSMKEFRDLMILGSTIFCFNRKIGNRIIAGLWKKKKKIVFWRVYSWTTASGFEFRNTPNGDKFLHIWMIIIFVQRLLNSIIRSSKNMRIVVNGELLLGKLWWRPKGDRIHKRWNVPENIWFISVKQQCHWEDAAHLLRTEDMISLFIQYTMRFALSNVVTSLVIGLREKVHFWCAHKIIVHELKPRGLSPD